MSAPCRKFRSTEEIVLHLDPSEHSYFLSFNPSERRWYVFAPSFGHSAPLAVINDDDAAVTVEVTMEGEGEVIVN